MIDDLVKYIRSKTPPTDWKIHGYSIGDDFGSIINDSPLYENSKVIKRRQGAQFYNSENSNTIKGIFLSIPFFKNRQGEILDVIKQYFGTPYFDHVHMNNRILYYTSHNLYVEIQKDDITKGLCLSIGECGRRLRLFSAENIIDSYIGFINHQSLLYEIESQSKLSKLTTLNIKAFKSLLLAFLGNSSTRWFISGHFIAESEDLYFNKLVKVTKEIEIYESPKRLDTTLMSEPSRYEMYKFWKMLFDYYSNNWRYIQNTRRFNFTMWKKKALEDFKIIVPREETQIKMKALKKVLCRMIDPDEKVFDLKEMIERYDYPSEDMAWLKANEHY